jgi:hypothetical protein
VIDVTGSATTIAALAAGVAGLGYLIRLVHRWATMLGKLLDLAEHELTHNHGTSIKDDVHGLALSVKVLQDTTDELRDEVTTLRHEFDREGRQ